MTEPLAVDPNALDTLATTLQQLAADNDAKVGPYLKEWLDVPDDVGGIVPTVAQAAHDVRDALTPNYATLGRITAAAAAELTKTATMYRTTDGATAAALDRTYPGAAK
ncbi:type VII secretion target [Nocardia sp. NBC_00416]|uniref:type VII secretion target n=1 Tax=Nocardia sp. NBC_00416 TaxID=2975991 RepID=UPI002E23C353